MRSSNDPRVTLRPRGRGALAPMMLLGLVLPRCAGPSRAELAAQSQEVARLSRAHAVHLPKEVESCVGVTLRLADEALPIEDALERDRLAARITAEELAAALSAAGVGACKDEYLAAVARGELSAEPMVLSMFLGIDPAGRVCAIVEPRRMEAIDPAAVPLIDGSAACVVKALFAARFPAGRVEDRERIILPYKLVAEPEGAKPVEPLPAPGG